MSSLVKRTSWVGSWGRSGSATSRSAESGATKGTGAAVTADGGKGAGAAASPAGTVTAAVEKRKLTVAGGGSFVTVRVVTPLLGGFNKDGLLLPNKVSSPRKWPFDGSLKFSNLMTVRSSRRLCGLRSTANSVDTCLVGAHFANYVIRNSQTFLR